MTKAQELKTKQAELEAYAKQQSVEQERVRWEEQRKTMQQDAQAKAQLAQYQDELARKRNAGEHEAARARNAELVALQEEGVRRQEQERARAAAAIEAERRATEKYKSDLESRVQQARALAEAEGRIKEGRANEDVNRRAALLALEEGRKKALAEIDAVFTNLGSAASALLSDRAKLSAAVAGLSALALGVYGAREGTRVAARALDRWLGTPSLVRETSRSGLWKKGGSSTTTTAVAASNAKRDFSDIALPGVLSDRVRGLAAATASTKRHNAPFRHMLFYGESCLFFVLPIFFPFFILFEREREKLTFFFPPSLFQRKTKTGPPGTGKSLAAKRLARTAGLDYAILSGGDVAPLGPAAVPALHSLFDWAERSPRGLLLFVDEADAFLGRRGAASGQGEALRGALNATLFRTGDQSRDFCLVLATNRPSDLDPAVLDRVDEALLFPLPGKDERKQILSLYLDRYISHAADAEGETGAAPRPLVLRARDFFRGKGSRDAIRVEGVSDADVEAAAAKTEGFSGRELAKLVASAQAAAYGTPDATLRRELFRAVVDAKVEEHKARARFVDEGAENEAAALALRGA